MEFVEKEEEDGTTKKKIVAGFFRDLWDTEKGLKKEDKRSKDELTEELHKCVLPFNLRFD